MEGGLMVGRAGLGVWLGVAVSDFSLHLYCGKMLIGGD